MKYDTKCKIKKGIKLLILPMIILFLSFVIPITIGNVECYREIAIGSCPEGSELTDLRPSSNWGLASYDYLCCKEMNNISRLKSDQVKDCSPYIFLEEDDRLCSKKYQYWKRVW